MAAQMTDTRRLKTGTGKSASKYQFMPQKMVRNRQNNVTRT
jgi:hypothetical protein